MKGGMRVEPKNFFQVLSEEAPDVNAAFFNLTHKLESNGGLDAKTFNLIYIGIQASRGEVASVVGHTMMAKQAGASREEIRDTILLTLMAIGINGVASCLVPALEAYDK
jgi:AhpD family alkylhydroperoxidase